MALPSATATKLVMIQYARPVWLGMMLFGGVCMISPNMLAAQELTARNALLKIANADEAPRLAARPRLAGRPSRAIQPRQAKRPGRAELPQLAMRPRAPQQPTDRFIPSWRTPSPIDPADTAAPVLIAPGGSKPGGATLPGGTTPNKPTTDAATAAPLPQRMDWTALARINNLHLAAAHGNIKALNSLLNSANPMSANIVNKLDRSGNTALLLAVAAGKAKVVQTLLASGADTNVANRYGELPLALAVRRKRVEITQLLIGAGAFTKLKAPTRAMIERAAVRSCNKDLISEVFASRAAAGSSNHLPRSIAGAYCDQSVLILNLLPLLDDARSDAGIGATAVFEAIRHKNKPLLKLLLDQDFPHNTSNKDGVTPLGEAAISGQADIVELLVAKKADVNHLTTAGNTPLMLAAQAKARGTLETLMSNGASVNQRNRTGLTALMIAAQAGHIEIVRALLEHGASTRLRNSRRETAAQLARDAGHNKLAKLLQ